MPDNEKQNNSLMAIGVGFFLIVLIFFFTVFKSPAKDAPSEDFQNDQVESQKKFESISQKNLLKKMTNRETVRIIDIRNAESFASEHILDSINAAAESFEIVTGEFSQSAEIIVVDDFGLTPAVTQALSLLSELGFTNITFLEGGFLSWKENFNPTIRLGNPNSFSDQSKVNYITSEELKIAIDENDEMFIIDARTPNLFAGAHVKDAVNIPLAELERQRSLIPPGKKIVIGGADPVSSFQGAVLLFDMGFTNVFALVEGFQ